MGAGPKDLLRRKGDAFAALGNIDALSDAQVLTAMAENPVLIERPVVIAGDRAVLCRPAERVWEIVD